MASLLELAEQCENATEPDRNLDADIAVALGHKIKMATANYTMEMFPAIEWQKPHPYAGMKEPCPSWTASIDAAMTLANDLRGLTLSRRSNPDMGGKDWIVSAGSNRSAARSWPLALCAVGLRAHAKNAPQPRTHE